MSPSVVAAPEWITTSSGCDAVTKANAAVAFPPGAGSAGGVDMAKQGGKSEKVRQKETSDRLAIRLITCRKGMKAGKHHKTS